MTPPPLPTDPGQPPARPPRRSPVRRSRTGPALLILLTCGGFAGLAAFLATRVPPYVTHAEALQMALAIEAANDAPALQKLVSMPPKVGGNGLEPVDWLLDHKHTGNYGYLTTRDEQTDRLALLFRWDKDQILRDYHELRLARIDGKVQVVGIWSMALGGSLTELAEEGARLAGDPTFVAYRDAAPKLSPPALLTAFRALPDPLRRSPVAAAPLLLAIHAAEPVTALELVEEYRKHHPGSLAGDVAWVNRVQAEFKYGSRKPLNLPPVGRSGQPAEPRLPEDLQREREHQEASGALSRIVRHTTDHDFAAPWQKLLNR